MPENLAYLKQLLASKKSRTDLRYAYYEMKRHPIELFSTKELKLSYLRPVLGWCAKAVDSLADRLQFRGWKNDNFNLTQIFQMNNADIFFDSAILSALINGCSFIYISEDETGFPRLEVIDGASATGIIDPVTNLLKEGYAILERDRHGTPVLEAHFETGRTTFYEKGQEPYEILNHAPAPLLVPIIYRPDAKRPFGHSRISRAMMSITDGAVRTTKRAEVSAEFYSVPQKYVVGTDPDAEPIDKWRSTISSMMQITKDKDGDRPTVGQFTQQSMQPHMDQIRTFAALFAGESGLTMDDLGFVSDNPSSAEAIKASHESLRVMAEKAQSTFGSCFLNVGYIAACLRDNFAYKRQQLYLTEPQWRPAFKPDAAALSGIGDGAIKINQAIPGYFNKDNLVDLTGIEPSDLPAPEEPYE